MEKGKKSIRNGEERGWREWRDKKENIKNRKMGIKEDFLKNFLGKWNLKINTIFWLKSGVLKYSGYILIKLEETGYLDLVIS